MGEMKAETTMTEPTRLCMFFPDSVKAPLGALERTIRYVKDPTGYLKEILGEDVFEQRRSQLCIPDTIDRDGYGSGEHKTHFERHMAKLFGKEHGLFFLTGVQAQLAAMKYYCHQAGRNHVAWHVTSHLEASEEQAYKHLYGLERTLLGNDRDKNPTVDEIREVLARPEPQRPAAIILEIPNRNNGCQTYTFEELETISSECRKAHVKLHCDGARIWEIEPFYVATAGKSFADLGRLFDSIYMSFYKGLGGVTGAALASNDAALIREAKVWQRRAGGNAMTLFYEIVDDERGFNENIGTFAGKWGKMIEVVDAITAATAQFTAPSTGRPIVNFQPPRPTCCQVHTSFEGFSMEELRDARDKTQEKTNIRVFNGLFTKELTLDERLKEQRALEAGETPAESKEQRPEDKLYFLEWMMMSVTEKFDTQVFVDGYVALCQELLSK